MYSEFRDPTRNNWRFSYKGSELAEWARKKVNYYQSREAEYREKLAKALSTPSRSVNSDANKKLETTVSDAALQREYCEVFWHEFRRTPDREFSLSISDVVFFGIAGHKPDSSEE